MAEMQISKEQALGISVGFRKFARFLEVFWLTKLAGAFYLASAAIEHAVRSLPPEQAPTKPNLDDKHVKAIKQIQSELEKAGTPSVKRNRTKPSPKSARKTKRDRS